MSRFTRLAHRLQPILHVRVRPGIGLVAAALIVFGAIGYGALRGEHVQRTIAQFYDVRDALANTAGFRINSVALSGAKQISRDDILAAAGVTPQTSLLFLDAEAARARLKARPWVADATVLKLYPDRLNIAIVERSPFALWQKDGKVSVIASDGTVVQAEVDMRYAGLPLVVGRGAERGASDVLAMIGRYPEIREQMRAAILVAERRWNIRLKNGLDIRLPESNPEASLAALVKLDREKKILSRDITAIDMRLADRITVKLSEQAAQAREDVLKERKPRRKGGDA
jgi:cell division protein FtsQ